MPITVQEFEQDEQGRRYQDVLSRPINRAALEAALGIMSRPNALRRMQEAETIHDRPALAGVVRDIEADPDFDKAFHAGRINETNRLKMAVGVGAKIIMERAHWRKTGRKGFLRAIANRFVSAERYVPAATSLLLPSNPLTSKK